MDLVALFALDKNPLELFVRVTAMWWFIFLIMRFLLRRNVGEVGPADILLLVLVADAASKGMTDDYSSITSGFVVVGTLFFWSWLLDWAQLRYEWVDKLMEPNPVLLVKNGRYRHRAMRREKISVDDIQGEIRKAGLPNVKHVKYVRFESDGKFSVIPKD